MIKHIKLNQDNLAFAIQIQNEIFPYEDASKEYNKAVAYAKKEWLSRYNFPADEIHCVKYGTTKANCTRNKAEFQILIDDNKKVRDGWTLGTTVNAQYNIMDFLKALI